MGTLLAGIAGARILEIPAISAISWSDARIVEMAQKRPELLSAALKRDPSSPFRWCDLGTAFLEKGQKEEARRCFERALVLGPNLVSNLSLAAQFYNRIGERKEALQCSARILELTPYYAPDILDSYTSSSYKLMDTLNYGLPRNPSVARDYFRLLLRGEDPESVRQAWDWLAERSIPDRELTNQYVDFLMKTKEYDRAKSIWLSSLGNNRGAYPTSELLYNAGFEAEPCGSVFDWRISRTHEADVTRDSRIAHSGKYSLRIEFGGEANLSYRNVAQETLLNPGKYRFSAFVRTEGISTDKGVGIWIYDADSQARLNVRTEQLTGTHEWTELHQDVEVHEGTRRIRIELVRDKSEKFDNLIKGIVWFDDLQMTNDE